jgi:hypothetical protein
MFLCSSTRWFTSLFYLMSTAFAQSVYMVCPSLPVPINLSSITLYLFIYGLFNETVCGSEDIALKENK